jgi:hypothetical protein
MDQIMIRFFTKRQELAEMCGTICPKIRKKLDKNIDFANNYEALPSAEHLFKVNGLHGEYEVRIEKMECSCRAWQLSGIPCRHACACLRHERIKPESVVHKCYSLDAFRATYSQVVMPCSDPRVWKKMNGPPLKPPKFDKQVGRPSKKRRKCPLEEDGGTRLSRHGIIGHCSVCNVAGHTKRTCPQLGRGPRADQAPAAEQAPVADQAPAAEQAPAADQAPSAEEEATACEQPTAAEQAPFVEEPMALQVVVPDDDEPAVQAPPKKIPVKRNKVTKVNCCTLSHISLHLLNLPLVH